MFVRTFFVLQRFVGYGTVFVSLLGTQLNRPWWQWVIGILVWVFGTLEYWKRPDESAPTMRLGIWVEVFAIVLWSVCVRDGLVLILLISPAARAAVHLGWRDTSLLVICSMTTIFAEWRALFTATWFLWVEVGGVIGTSGYSLTVGELVRQRDRLKRAVQLTAFEREQHAKDEERLRMAGQLHDTLGQHWTAVIRALDVAEQVNGEQQKLFLSKARGAAMDGLSAMRDATHTWNDGRQGPREWLQYAEDSLRRLQDAVDLVVQFQSVEIDWSRFENRTNVSEILARTLIEGATNAIRHGGARHLTITLQSDVKEVRAVIRDDGKGLKTGHKAANGGMGITALRNAAEEAGGSLHLECITGNGTTLLLRVPYTW